MPSTWQAIKSSLVLRLCDQRQLLFLSDSYTIGRTQNDGWLQTPADSGRRSQRQPGVRSRWLTAGALSSRLVPFGNKTARGGGGGRGRYTFEGRWPRTGNMAEVHGAKSGREPTRPSAVSPWARFRPPPHRPLAAGLFDAPSAEPSVPVGGPASLVRPDAQRPNYCCKRDWKLPELRKHR